MTIFQNFKFREILKHYTHFQFLIRRWTFHVINEKYLCWQNISIRFHNFYTSDRIMMARIFTRKLWKLWKKFGRVSSETRVLQNTGIQVVFVFFFFCGMSKGFSWIFTGSYRVQQKLEYSLKLSIVYTTNYEHY